MNFRFPFPLRNTTEGGAAPAAVVKPGEVTGGPGTNPPQGAPGVTTPAAAPAATAPVFKGAGGEFKTVEDLAAYTSNLERQLVEKTFLTPATPPPAPIAAPQKTVLQEVSETIFTDPEGSLTKLSDHIENKVEQRHQQAAASKRVWDNFYEKNPDLNNVRFIVESIQNERRAELAPLKTQVALDLIASEARKRVDLVRQQAGIMETIVSGSGTITGSGSGSGSGTNPAPAKPQTFVDEVKEMRAKRKARY